MSEVETHKGTLIPMILSGYDMEERAQCACLQMGYEKQDYHKSWLDCLKDEGYREVLVQGDVVYLIDDRKLDPSDFSIAYKGSDGNIRYCISYYNGGASFNEVIEEALQGMEK